MQHVHVNPISFISDLLRYFLCTMGSHTANLNQWTFLASFLKKQTNKKTNNAPLIHIYICTCLEHLICSIPMNNVFVFGYVANAQKSSHIGTHSSDTPSCCFFHRFKVHITKSNQVSVCYQEQLVYRHSKPFFLISNGVCMPRQTNTQAAHSW